MLFRLSNVMSRFNLKTVINYLSFFIAVLLLSGCASVPDDNKEGPLFYPSLPNPPRIQYLTTFSTLNDLTKTKTNFSDFILGKQSDKSILVKPYGVAMHGGKIYVVDAAQAGYVVLDLVTRKYKFISGGTSGKMKKPINITIDIGGTKYISDTGRGQVLVFDSHDKYIRAYGIKGQFKPSDVAITVDRLFVTDLKSHMIHEVDKNTGETLNRIGHVGSKEGEFYFPTNISAGPDGHLYVSDTGNFRVQKFTQKGKFVRSFGSIGSGFGKFARPKGISIDKDGRMYVVDAAFENVQMINKSGKLLLFFGKAGDKPGDINLPADVSIDYDNVKYFQMYADPKFKLEYVILVSSQFGVNKINIYGFGRMQGMDYSETENK